MIYPYIISFLKFGIYKYYRKIVRLKEFHSKNRFEKRIIRRLVTFYNDTHDISFIYRKYEAAMPIEKWKGEKYWQMKLENKLNAKEFAIKNYCKVAELYWKGNAAEFVDVDLKSLPEHFTIKPNFGHSSQNIFLISHWYNFFDSKYYTPDELKAKVLKSFKNNPNLQILIEEFLPDSNGEYKMTWDYKFYTFNGRIAFIQVNEKSQKKKKISYYTTEWKPIRRTIIKNEILGKPLPKPVHFDEMLVDVKKLSREYQIFARIDYYDSANGAIFGEFTPTPRRGRDFTSYASRHLIKSWDKYCNGLI